MYLDSLSDSYGIATRAARVTFYCNLLLCSSKLVVGWAGHSFALVADGLNNLTDIGVSAGLFIGMLIAKRPPDHNHAYGHGKFEQEVSRLISVAVMATGIGIILSAASRLRDVHAPPSRLVLVVAFFAILVKLAMYRYQTRMAIRLNSSALAADALNHKSDVAATSCVLIGTLAIWVGGSSWAYTDDVAAIIVGVLMIVAAGHTFNTASMELLDEMPPQDLVDRIRVIGTSCSGVSGVEQVIGRKTGMHYLIDLHLEVSGEMTVTEAHYLGHQVKDRIIKDLPEIVDIIVHIEPASPKHPIEPGRSREVRGAPPT